MITVDEAQRLTTHCWVVDPVAPDPAIVEEAAALLRAGRLVAFPTETVYGLGADALNASAVRRIFAAKERPSNDPVIVHVADSAEVARVASAVPPLARALMERFWPGPLTLVLPKAAEVPLEVTAGGPTVAVRCPAHPLALALIRAAGTPIAAPSANRFSHTSPTTAQHVWDDLAGRIDAILDGGPAPIGVESTVLDCSGPRPVILRPGGVTREALEAALGLVDVAHNHPANEGADLLASPGLLARHYAPDGELRLLRGANSAVRRALARFAASARADGRRVALLIAEEDASAVQGAAEHIAVVGSLHDLPTVAHNLFRALRELDAHHPDLILTREFPRQGLGAAIDDRLRRAAHRIMRV